MGGAPWCVARGVPGELDCTGTMSGAGLEMLTDAECCLAHCRECILSVWRGAPNRGLVEAHSHLARRLIRTYGQTAMMIIIERCAPLPNRESLELIESFYSDTGAALRCVAQVVEGSGFAPSASRAMMSTINLAVQRKGFGADAIRSMIASLGGARTCRTKVFASAEPAAPWLVSQLCASPTTELLSPHEVLSALLRARARYRWKPAPSAPGR